MLINGKTLVDGRDCSGYGITINPDNPVKLSSVTEWLAANPVLTTVWVRPEIKDVIFNPPATIVFFKDGSKVVVKANNEEFDKEKGLAMAMIKKLNGNKSNYNNIFKKWCK